MQGRSWSATRSVRFRGEGGGGRGRGGGRGIVVALKPFLSRAHLPLSCVRRATGPSPLLSMAYRRDRDKRLGILNAQKPRYEYTRGRSKPLDPDVADVSLVYLPLNFASLSLSLSLWLRQTQNTRRARERERGERERAEPSSLFALRSFV